MPVLVMAQLPTQGCPRRRDAGQTLPTVLHIISTSSCEWKWLIICKEHAALCVQATTNKKTRTPIMLKLEGLAHPLHLVKLMARQVNSVFATL